MSKPKDTGNPFSPGLQILANTGKYWLIFEILADSKELKNAI